MQDPINTNPIPEGMPSNGTPPIRRSREIKRTITKSTGHQRRIPPVSTDMQRQGFIPSTPLVRRPEGTQDRGPVKVDYPPRTPSSSVTPNAQTSEPRTEQKPGFFSRMRNNFTRSNTPQTQTPDRTMPAMTPAAQPVPQQREYDVNTTPMRIMPVGGLDEVGGNSMLVEYGNDIAIIDYGFLFPGTELPGVDFIIPDLTYVEKNLHKLRGFIITHAHLDHIGALPHILAKLNFPPIYATKFTMGMIKKGLDEAKILKIMQPKLHIVDRDIPIQMGKITFEYFKVSHSIPDCSGVYIQTPAGTAVHTGDFKFDFNPADGGHADLEKMARIGERGVDLLMADSTNATHEGFSISEMEVVKSLEKLIVEAEGKRIIIATFSSLLGRLQQLINIAEKYDRTIFVNGRSMINNLVLAREMEVVKFKKERVRRVTANIKDTPPEKTIILTTGSQGEEMAGLTRMALGSHQHIQISREDVVIVAAKPIPATGNDRKLVNVINFITRREAKVICTFNNTALLHTSGHAFRGELRMMMKLMKPKNIMPIHGELFMRVAHRQLGINLGIPEKNAHLIDNGEIMEILNGQVTKSTDKIKLLDQISDNGMIGAINDPIIMERLTLMEEGVVTVLFKVRRSDRTLLATPKIISRGFVLRAGLQRIYDELEKSAKNSYEKLLKRSMQQDKRKDIIHLLKAELSRFLVQKFDKKPLIIPVIIEI
ncbi:MAG: ribonuclease J [Candidatus Gracilibacteria bacterium]